MENVRIHIKEEETGLFPQVRKAFSPSELKDMAEALTIARNASPTRPHPRAPEQGTSRDVRQAGNGSAREMANESSFLM